jgi:hypothetical protein
LNQNFLKARTAELAKNAEKILIKKWYDSGCQVHRSGLKVANRLLFILFIDESSNECCHYLKRAPLLFILNLEPGANSISWYLYL